MSDTTARISLIVHGGAGDIPPDERPAHRAGLERALEVGWRVLLGGGPALEAVEAAITVLENDPAFDAGVGSVLRLDGTISLDASIMQGQTRAAGAVANVSRVRHPIRLARMVLERTPHVFLVSAGAEALAARHDLEMCDPQVFVVPRELARLRRILDAREAVEGPRGTVGAVAHDARGHVAAGTSTGGAPGSPPGRVGDSPIIGAGTFADSRHGGASCTGQGENIIRVTLAREVVRRLESGSPPREAALWAVDHLRSETGGTGGVICLDRHGAPGAAFNTEWMGSLAREAELPRSRP